MKEKFRDTVPLRKMENIVTSEGK